MRRCFYFCSVICLASGALLPLRADEKAPPPAEKAKIVATEARIAQLSSAVMAYEATGGVVPSAKQGLKALVEKPVDRPVPLRWVKMALEADLVDAWKTPFAYHSPARKGGDQFEIVSAGPDKKMNTDDDISSVQQE